MTSRFNSVLKFATMQRFLRFGVALTLLFVSFASGIVLNGSAGAVSNGPQSNVAFLDLHGQPTNSVELQPQVTDNVLVRVANSGSSAGSSSTSPSLTVSVPEGISIIGVDSVNPGSVSTVTGSWDCTEVSKTTKKCLLKNSTGQPQVLDAMTQTLAAVRLDSSDSGKAVGAKIEATAEVGGAPSVSASASVQVDTPVVGLALNIIGQSQIQSGQATSITYQVSNQGAVDAISYSASQGAVPAVTLTNLLPARRFTSWTSNSEGWKCTGAATIAPTCSLTEGTLTSGDNAPPLIINFTLAQGRASSTTDASPNAAVSWPVTIAEAMNGSVATVSQNVQLYVGPRPIGKLDVRLRAFSSSMLSPGQSVDFSVKHAAVDGFAKGIVDTLTIPKGITTSAVNSGGWKCPAGSEKVVCTFAGVVPPGGDPSYVLTLNAASTAQSTTGLLKVSSVGNGGEATALDAQPIFLVDIGGARLQIERLMGRSDSTAVLDGTPLVDNPGIPADATFHIVNRGNKPLAAGAVITLVASLTRDAIAYLQTKGVPDPYQIELFTPPSLPGGPVCTTDFTKYSLSCSLTLKAPLDVGNVTSDFSFLFNMKDSFDANVLSILPPELQLLFSQGNLLTLTASVTNNPQQIAPISYTPKILIKTVTNKLLPVLGTSALKIGAAPSTVAFYFANSGDALKEAIATFSIPNTMKATGISGSTCNVSALSSGSASQTVSCTITSISAGTQQLPSISASQAFLLENVSATTNLTIGALINSDGNLATVPITIPVSSVSTSNTKLSAPGPVTGLSAISSGLTQATLSWTAPTQVGAGLNDYTVSCSPQCIIASQPRASDTTFTVTGLATGVSYTFSVISNASDNQQSSAVTSNSVKPGSISAPVISSLTSTSATVSWQAPQGANSATLYSVCLVDFISQQCVSTPTVATSLTRLLTPLSPSTNYAVAIVANPLTAPTLTTVTFRTPSVSPSLVSSSSALTAHAMKPRTATSTVPPSSGASFSQVCSDVVAAISAKQTTLDENLGGLISVSLTGISVNGDCSTGSATVSFTGGSLNLYGVYGVTIQGGSISSAGFTFSSASLSTPSAWPGGALTLPSTAPVSLLFSNTAASVSFQGSFASSGLFGLPLPSGWTAQTSVAFSYANSVVGIAVSSTGGPSGSGLTISGSANTTGDFSVSVTGNMSLNGATISGVSANWASGSPFTFSGTAAVGGATLGVTGSYLNTSNWTINANGTVALFGVTPV
ncbi:MAG: fibronectin type III domain-containing protein, partial [Acidimicrobiaceae bacterium]